MNKFNKETIDNAYNSTINKHKANNDWLFSFHNPPAEISGIKRPQNPNERCSMFLGYLFKVLELVKNVSTYDLFKDHCLSNNILAATLNEHFDLHNEEKRNKFTGRVVNTLINRYRNFGFIELIYLNDNYSVDENNKITDNTKEYNLVLTNKFYDYLIDNFEVEEDQLPDNYEELKTLIPDHIEYLKSISKKSRIKKIKVPVVNKIVTSSYKKVGSKVTINEEEEIVESDIKALSNEKNEELIEKLVENNKDYEFEIEEEDSNEIEKVIEEEDNNRQKINSMIKDMDDDDDWMSDYLDERKEELNNDWNSDFESDYKYLDEEEFYEE